MILLKDARPDLAEQLVDKSLLDKLSVGSGKKVEWECEKGHRWVTPPAYRAKTKKASCPICSGRKVLRGFNDLATVRPDVAALCADPEDAFVHTEFSSAKIKWRCEKGHEWMATVRNVSRGNRCPYCSNKAVLAGYNNLATTHPDLAAELVDQSLATKLVAGSNKKVEWVCSKNPNHRWMAAPNDRAHAGHGCPFCSRHRPFPGETDLATTHPELAAELADQNLATEIMAGTNKKVEWVCLKNPRHRWEASVASRALFGVGCPYCAGQKALADESDLATTHPEVAEMLADPFLAKELRPGSKRKVEWICPNNPKHRWVASVRSVVQGARCPICRGLTVMRGENDLWTTHPYLASQLVNPEEGYEVTAGSSRVLKWRCPDHPDHVWEQRVASRVYGGLNCPYCANKRVKIGFNDIATTHPELAAMMVNPEDARRLTFGSDEVVEWKCDKGHRWFAKVCDARRHGIPSCPVCLHRRSGAERELATIVGRLLGDPSRVKTNVRFVLPRGRELDVYVPDMALAIEFNGVFWHSEQAGCASTRHYEKFKDCEALGIRLVQVWEDDWRDRRDVVVEMLAAKLGCRSRLSEVLDDVDSKMLTSFGARKGHLVEVGGREARALLTRHHIQGAVTVSRSFGLVDADGDIRALLSLRSPNGQSRMRRSEGEWEIVRYATVGSVPGGFSRLLKFAERALIAEGVSLTRWITFSANDVSDGGLYEKTGFIRDGELRPDYKYVGNFTKGVRVSKEAFQRKRFREDSNLKWNEAWTEHEAALANGLYRVYDSGKVRWVREVGGGRSLS